MIRTLRTLSSFFIFTLMISSGSLADDGVSVGSEIKAIEARLKRFQAPLPIKKIEETEVDGIIPSICPMDRSSTSIGMPNISFLVSCSSFKDRPSSTRRNVP